MFTETCVPDHVGENSVEWPLIFHTNQACALDLGNTLADELSTKYPPFSNSK